MSKGILMPKESPLVGSELTKEPFRWDQRIFGVTLRLSNSSTVNFDSPLTSLCEATGGKNVFIGNVKQAISVMDIFTSVINSPPSVVVNFEPLYKGDGYPVVHHKSIIINTPHPGHWPIPEDYIITPNMSSLLPRNAHPNIKYKPQYTSIPVHPPDFPYDVYNVETSSLTKWILETAQTAKDRDKVCFEVYITPCNDNNGKNAYPFGYFKCQSNSSNVILCVLPYNYPALFHLLNNYQSSGTLKWKQDWKRYLATTPSYYLNSLRNSIKRWNPPNGMQGHTITINNLMQEMSVYPSLPSSILNKFEEIKTSSENYINVLESGIISSRQNTKEDSLLTVTPLHKLNGSQFLDHLKEIKRNLVMNKKIDSQHSILISQMSNYQEYLAKNPKPRSIFGEEDDARPFFGSPWAKPKKSSETSPNFVDEADVNVNDVNTEYNRVRRRAKRKGHEVRNDVNKLPKKIKSNETDDQKFILPAPLPRPPLPQSPVDTPLPTPPGTPTRNQDYSFSPAQLEKSLQKLSNELSKNEQMSEKMELEPVVIDKIEELKNARHNNEIKADVLKIIRHPSVVSKDKLIKILSNLKGTSKVKIQVAKEIIGLGKLYKRNIKNIVDEYLVHIN